ncbi:MAG TPA: GAF domain-containing protein, partial [Gemmatimonadales bacterium]|nr:GAF domain-containing protein [Gemmatimonadales bacterium]
VRQHGTLHIPDVLAQSDFTDVGSTSGARTSLTVPLGQPGDLIGVLVARRMEVRPFTSVQIKLLETFADQAVIAIENVRLFRELKESLEQQTATSEILGVIASSPTDIQPVLDSVAQNAARLCDASDALIFRVNGDRQQRVASYGSMPVMEETSNSLTRGSPLGRAMLDRETIHVHDLAASESDFPDAKTRGVALGVRTALVAPLLREGISIGAIYVRRTEVRPFTDKQIALLKTFADQAVIAIENVRLFTELQEKNTALTRAHTQVTEALDRQTATADILRVISQAQTDVQPVFEAIADSAMRLFRAWSVGVSRYDGELASLAATRGGLPGSGESLLAAQQAPHRPSHDTLPGRAVLTRAVQHVVDATIDHSWGPEGRRIASDRGFRSAVSVPMLRGREAVGAIVVTRAQPGGFSPTEIGLLQTFGDQAVIAVENARLLAELQARTADLTRSVGQLTALGEVGQAVSSSLDLDTVLTTIVSRAVELSGLDGGVIFEYDEAAEEFAQRAATDPTGALAEARRTARIAKGEGVVGRTAVTLGPAHESDITVAGAYEGRLRAMLISAGVRAVLAVPMLREGHLIGCLAVTRNAAGDFAPETM